MSILLATLLTLGHTGMDPKPIMGERPTVLVVGDSYTLRSGICAFPGIPGPHTYQECAIGIKNGVEGGFPYELSYGSYLESLGNRVELVANLGRGGDTCTALDEAADYPAGSVHAGERRGLLHGENLARIANVDAEIVSILIGINDVNKHGKTPGELQQCLESLYNEIASSDRKIMAMTYPGVSWLARLVEDENGQLVVAKGPWPKIGLKAAAWNVPLINNAIREAVTKHNQAFPDRPVILADTSDAWNHNGANALSSDGAHPNEMGAQVLAHRWDWYACLAGAIDCAMPKWPGL